MQFPVSIIALLSAAATLTAAAPSTPIQDTPLQKRDDCVVNSANTGVWHEHGLSRWRTAFSCEPAEMCASYCDYFKGCQFPYASILSKSLLSVPKDTKLTSHQMRRNLEVPTFNAGKMADWAGLWTPAMFSDRLATAAIAARSQNLAANGSESPDAAQASLRPITMGKHWRVFVII